MVPVEGQVAVRAATVVAVVMGVMEATLEAAEMKVLVVTVAADLAGLAATEAEVMESRHSCCE